MDTVSVSPIDLERDGDVYARFLSDTPGATIYASDGYRRLVEQLCEAGSTYLGAWRGRKLEGVLPLMSRSGPHGTIVNSLPFFGSYGGVLAASEAAAGALASAWAEVVKAPGVASATAIDNPFSPAGSALETWAATDERLAQWTVLPPQDAGPEALLASLDGSARRNIRKAEASGVRVEPEGSFAWLESVHRDNMAEIGGRSKPSAFFSAIPALMREGTDYKLYTAWAEGRPIAGLLVFLFKGFVEYITPVTATGDRDLQPTAAILARAMTDAISEGRRIWNWGGTWTSQTGVYRFKRKWGALERRYSYRTVVNDPALPKVAAADVAQAYPGFYAFRFDVPGAEVRP
jgi:hypothetical protein